MTLTMRLRDKLWECWCDGIPGVGYGYTLEQAYNDWKTLTGKHA